MAKFGKHSKKRIKECHPYLKSILELAIKRSRVDFGVSEGHRSLERQQELYARGLTKINGTTKKGKHNKFPSEAADIYAYHRLSKYRKIMAYDKTHLAYIAGVIDCCAKELKNIGEINCDIRWGGDWNKNGVIDIDQSFDDFPHFEIVNIK